MEIEIERAYHESKGREFVILTEFKIPLLRAQNWRVIRPILRQGATIDISLDLIASGKDLMSPRASFEPWDQIVTSCDSALKLAPGTAARIADYLIATKQWTVDLDKPFSASKPIPLLGVSADPTRGHLGINPTTMEAYALFRKSSQRP